jgi:hypothetical protein
MILNAAVPGPGRRRLAQLGLRVEHIRDALLYGAAERATYSALDANGIGEAARWSRHVRRMSEVLLADGWTRLEIDNQPTLIHPGKKWSLVVASGTGGTGDPNYRPTTKNPKGRSIREAVRANSELALFTPQSVVPDLDGLRETWILLTYASDSLLRAEVSLPEEMRGEFVSRWTHRIILPSIDLGGDDDEGEQEEPPDYDFVVPRR